MPARLVKYVRCTLVCLVAIAIVGQSLGAKRGGFLCLGCAEAVAGIAIVETPCGPGTCCTKHEFVDEHPGDEPALGSDHECDCLDVKLSPQDLTITRGSLNLSFELAGLASFPVNLEVARALLLNGARHLPQAGPEGGGSLTLGFRRTILRF
jgi:hypothetical protein